MPLKRYTDATITASKDQAVADLKRLDQKMRDRLDWSDIELLRSILDTQNWQCLETGEDDGSEDDSSLVEIKAALSTITEFFQAPLEAK